MKIVPGGGGGAAPTLRISQKKGVFFKTSACPRLIVKEGYFLYTGTKYEGWKSPYNPRSIRGSDAEWLPKWLDIRVCCR